MLPFLRYEVAVPPGWLLLGCPQSIRWKTSLQTPFVVTFVGTLKLQRPLP
jgi:hypothetical protein